MRSQMTSPLRGEQTQLKKKFHQANLDFQNTEVPTSLTMTKDDLKYQTF